MKQNDTNRKRESDAAETATPATRRNLAVGTDRCPAVPTSADNYNEINADAFHDANVSAVRCFKGGVVALHTAAVETQQIKELLGDGFHDFARTRLGLTPTMANFLLRVPELSIDPAQLSPIVDVKMSSVMGVLGQVDSLYMETAGDGADCSTPTGSATTSGSEAEAADTTAVAMADEGTVAGDNAVAQIKVVVGDPVDPVDAAHVAKPDILSGFAVTAQADATTDMKPVDAPAQAVAEPAAQRQTLLTTQQRRFIAERSVTLLVRVKNGELAVDEAMRQAEALPKRKGQ